MGAAVAAVAFLCFAGPALANSPSTKSSGGAGFGASMPFVFGHGDSKHLGDRVLREGMHGHDVRVLQAYLSVAGFGTVVDGAFGPSTLRSVEAFERAHNLPANGVVTFTVAHTVRAAVATVQAIPPTGKVRINADGTGTAPADAPQAVQAMVTAANQIIDTSYCVGGGHGKWNSSCYDCSGAVSYVLHGAGLLRSSEPSTALESYGSPGPGQWVTIYGDSSHAFIVIAGRAFDTANFGGPNIPSGSGPRWRSNPLGNLADGGGYVIRHPAGL